jgi:hypothetical protein
MKKEVMISNAGVKVVADGRWNVFAGDISLTYGFDVKQGLVLEQFDNLAGHRPVHYNPGSTSLLPFKDDRENPWVLESAEITEAGYGGRRTARLDLVISTFETRLYFHAVAFPGVSIIRQWFDLENTAVSRAFGYSLKPFRMNFSLDDYTDTYRCTWFKGGKPKYDHGQICNEAVGSETDIHLHSLLHYDYMPMLLTMREQDPNDGFMVALDYCGTWDLNIKRDYGPVSVEFTLDDKKSFTLAPHEKFELPVMTLGVFKESIDELMKTVYDWQYTYLWDYTNNDYYAKSRIAGWWVYNSRNLHEQFGYRLVNMNLQHALLCQEAGYDMVWDDAGWSVYPGWPPDSYGSVFSNIYEGPDYRQSQRFFKKCGLKWLLWFAGHPTLGLLESKEGAWGSFEWRTDGVGIGNLREEWDFKNKVKRYLEGNPDRSFHTCSGGSTYAHTFDIQRYSNYNYSADLGAGPYGNYYFSYFEVPDKWGDIACWVGQKYFRKDGATVHPYERMNFLPGPLKKEDVRYVPEFARARLGMVPLPGAMNFPEDVEASRKDLETYRFLLYRGVAGRWSYTFHPQVLGDREYYYLQRTSPDFKRACIILRHRPTKPVTIFPRNLLPEESYQLSFQNTFETCNRSGRDLMENGIRLERAQDGELVYLNLPGRPGSKTDKITPEEPGMAVCRIENNIGYTGIGVYWSAGIDNNWISFYEISRNNVVIGRVTLGDYYFDFTEGWDTSAVYAVRSVDGDGNRSLWRKAQKIEGESLQFSALGGHFDEMGRNGWSAEISTDLKTFTPMTWVPPEKNPAADLGGTPNQTGGIEGYWQAGACARIGRGWQQASSDVYCVRTYTVQANGVVRVTGRAMKEWYHQNKGCDLRVCMLHNGHCVWGWADVKRSDLYGAAHDMRLQVKKGDTIRFIVDKSSGGDEDLLPWLERVNLVGWISRLVYEDKTSHVEKINPIFINCGRDTAITDHQGHVWQADQYFSTGVAKNFSAESAVQNVDAPIFSTGRVGDDVAYDVPVALGLYSVRLCFAEPISSWSGEREMDIEINGKIVARNFDIVGEGRGIWKKVEKIYHYIVPNAEGKIHICLKARKGDALVQAIEVAPEQRDVVRINCGSDQSFIDWAGDVWQADTYFKGGRDIQATGEIVQATPTIYDQGLYLVARMGDCIEYRIPVRPGIYSVHLKFAEVWIESRGNRPMNISINARQLKKKWDPVQSVERNRMAADLRFEGVSPVDGKITVVIEAVGENPAIVQAIEIE